VREKKSGEKNMLPVRVNEEWLSPSPGGIREHMLQGNKKFRSTNSGSANGSYSYVRLGRKGKRQLTKRGEMAINPRKKKRVEDG